MWEMLCSTPPRPTPLNVRAHPAPPRPISSHSTHPTPLYIAVLQGPTVLYVRKADAQADAEAYYIYKAEAQADAEAST